MILLRIGMVISTAKLANLFPVRLANILFPSYEFMLSVIEFIQTRPVTLTLD